MRHWKFVGTKEALTFVIYRDRQVDPLLARSTLFVRATATGKKDRDARHGELIPPLSTNMAHTIPWEKTGLLHISC